MSAGSTPKQMTIYDWSDGSVLARTSADVLDTVNYPVRADWEILASKIPERSGASAVMMYDSCETYDWYDRSASGLRPVPYRGYAYYVPDQLHWTETDNTSLHKDILEGNGENGLPPGWRIYVRNPDDAEAAEYARALATSPMYYFIKDTGSCMKPTKEMVYRVSVDPDDTTKLRMEYWGNMASTSDIIYSRLYVKDSTDGYHTSSITVQNGNLVVSYVPTYISSNDLFNCFKALLARDIVIADLDSDHLARTTNDIVESFAFLASVDEVRSRRTDRKSNRLYVTAADVKSSFSPIYGRRINVRDFTFNELRRTTYRIVDCVRTMVAKATRTDPEANSGVRYLSVEDVAPAFADILNAILTIEDFTLLKVAKSLNKVLVAIDSFVDSM